MAERYPATPEAELKELRRKRKQRRRTFRRWMRRNLRAIKDAVTRAQLVRRLARAEVLSPWVVIQEADRAAREAEIPREEFLAMCLVVLRKETGVPQRNIYGCDWGPRNDRPYCHQRVTKGNAAPYIRWVLQDPYASRMNGMSWTQTTWWEKLERVLDLGPRHAHKPWAHMRVCFTDLAELRAAYGVGEAFRRYNGSGPAAEEYRRVCEDWMTWARDIVNG